MNELPQVSIITPSYNQVEFLEATIQSVLSQGYPHLDYGVVDGGSTDGSLEVIKRYEGQIDWWISEPDRGQADAINKGMERTGGEIIAWLNSDDIYLPGAVQKAVEVFRKFDPGLVYGDALTIDAQGTPLNALRFGDWGLSDLMRFRVICQPAVFIKRKAWESVGGLDTTYHCMLDHHLWIRVAAQYNIQHNPNILAASRYHKEAKNVTIAPEFAREIFRVKEWMSADPDLAEKYEKDEKRILGGAYRLSARYLLDGNLPKQALFDYLHAVRMWPSYGLEHWHRILFAGLSLLTGLKAEDLYRTRRPMDLIDAEEWRGWPGLSLPKGD